MSIRKYRDNRINVHIEGKYTVYCIYLSSRRDMYPLYFGSTNSTIEGRYLKDRHFKRKYIYSKAKFLHKLYSIRGPIKTEIVALKSDFKNMREAERYEKRQIREIGKDYLLINVKDNEYAWKIKNNKVIFNNPKKEKSFKNMCGVNLEEN